MHKWTKNSFWADAADAKYKVNHQNPIPLTNLRVV